MTDRYKELKHEMIGEIVSLMNTVEAHATVDELREMLALQRTGIIQIIEKLATSPEHGHALVDQVTKELRDEWEEVINEGFEVAEVTKV
ncbi:hypothetical protein JQ582_37240 [Bradyrhizobium japonicum]|uniref:hypothetical protein n=1 Tax=Bradyrhizobium TaxID=374 RepID=UPI001BABA43C|nr:hypothetical protein [Bradyrhizobium japonicum]MBR0734847.1 hypothetical protein [Bradyrhizobium japonicum]MBR0749581.1 hypothetical protein [Bradyrhizobium japonicum]MBR0808445.1 hypothetical protein [Bradyrhizobium japonicum]